MVLSNFASIMLLSSALLTMGCNLFITCEAFASPEGGWKSRPLVPEIEQARGDGDDDKKATSKRVPWDVLRFVRQSSRFVTMPVPFFSKRDGGARTAAAPGQRLWEADDTVGTFDWAPLDDVVMGGASESSFDGTTGRWRGTVTDANNGGFVGVRTTPFRDPNALDLSNCRGLELRVRSNGGGGKRRYKFIVRDSTDFNGVCWTSSFDCGGSSMSSMLIGGAGDGAVTTVRLPFAEQVPTIFARTVPDQTFDVTNVVGFQLAYSKFEYDGDINPNFSLGDFSLQILDIRTY